MMIIKKRSHNFFVLAALTLGVLSACGESDIEDIEARELDAAQRDSQLQVQVEATTEAEAEAEKAEAEKAEAETAEAEKAEAEKAEAEKAEAEKAEAEKAEAEKAEAEKAEAEKAEAEKAEAEAAAAEQAETTPDIAAANPGVDTSDMELLFSDEFNGTAIDNAKWNTAQTWGPDLIINNELQYYVDTLSNADFGYSPFSFDGESLIISAVETPADLKAAANDQPYLSGVLTSAGKFDMTYGYIEARMDFPAGTGLWPAFWMLSAEFEGLKPQLFIAEGDGAKSDSVFHNYNYHDADGNLRSPGQWQVTQDDFADGFHTLGVNWTAEELLFYIDGEPRYRIVGDNVSKQAMYLIANLAVGGVWVGVPDSATTYPAELKIDYIRAYRHNGL